MNYYLILAIAIILILLLIVFLTKGRKEYAKMEKSGKYPEGHFFSKWMSIGMALGIPFGLALGNIALGIGPGLAIGVAIGMVKEAQARKEGKIRYLTKTEKKRRRWAFLISFILLGIILAITIAMIFSLR